MRGAPVPENCDVPVVSVLLMQWLSLSPNLLLECSDHARARAEMVGGIVPEDVVVKNSVIRLFFVVSDYLER